MGGNCLGVGNVSACAEFNFWCDPESVHIVLAESKCPITIFPWEPSTEAGNGMPFDDWRIRKLSSHENPFTNLLDPVEIKVYKINAMPNWTPCDSFLAACFIAPKLIKKVKSCHVTIELAGNYT